MLCGLLSCLAPCTRPLKSLTLKGTDTYPVASDQNAAAGYNSLNSEPIALRRQQPFGWETMDEPVKVLTIGGSDSGGAAGVQADLRAWAALGAYGLCALTNVTAQNSVQVAGVWPVSAEFLALQLTTVLSDYGADAVKTGFIGRVDLIQACAASLRQLTCPIVIDPVLVNQHGQPMFSPEVVAAYRQWLLPLATIVTPNCHEAALLTGLALATWDDLATAARRLHAEGARYVLIKRWRVADMSEDWLFDGRAFTPWRAPWLPGVNTHGSGDTLSAALTAYLGQGRSMAEAVSQAHALTARALQAGADWQLGRGHGPVWAVDASLTKIASIAP